MHVALVGSFWLFVLYIRQYASCSFLFIVCCNALKKVSYMVQVLVSRMYALYPNCVGDTEALLYCQIRAHPGDTWAQ